MTLIAVYGTLRQHQGNWSWALGTEPLSTERLTGWQMYGLHGGFPGCVPTGNEEDSIVIEVYDVDDETLQSINRLEGYNPNREDNTFYDRKEVETTQGTAYIYEWMGGHTNPVAHGDWVQYRQEIRENQYASRTF